MATQKMFFSGFGGQGVLMIGRNIAYAAMLEGKEVTFLPSYGPEMRGGTANCTVIVSDKMISSPLIYEADLVCVMNLPSLIKFERMVKPDKFLFINSSIISQSATRSDIQIAYVNANEIAKNLGNEKAANMVMLGAIVKKTGVVSFDSIEHVMEKTFAGKKQSVIEL
ncbi:MAG: 2-oxoacid:ferredoxin oxidoreductase subunit gamma, partial [Flexilinea flocculi]|nr:2-oxoacid:ferredoxin oxidoreductase subunit gamma [Flexilinea flocculi]